MEPMKPTPALNRAGDEEGACKAELEAKMLEFMAALRRGHPEAIIKATEAVHVATTALLDAQAAVWAVAKRDFRE